MGAVKERWDNYGKSKPFPRKETSLRVWVVPRDQVKDLTEDEMDNPDGNRKVKYFEQQLANPADGQIKRR